MLSSPLLKAVSVFRRLATLDITEAIVEPRKISPLAMLQEGRCFMHALSTNLLSNLSLVLHMRLAASKLKSCPGCACMCLTRALLDVRFLMLS